MNAAITTAQAITSAQAQSDVDTAVATLTSAVGAFKPIGLSDLSALAAEIGIAQAAVTTATVGNVPGNYTQTSVDTLNTAITTAQAVKDTQAQSDVDTAVTTLTSAVSAFTKVPLSDLTNLNGEITTAQGDVAAATIGTVPGNYTQASVDTLNAAITTAQAITDAQAQSDVDAAVTTLTSAVSTFQPIPPVTLSSIAITTPASKLAYIVGQPLDLTGLVVTGTNSA